MQWLRRAETRKPSPFSQALELLNRHPVVYGGGARVGPVFRVLAGVLGPVAIVFGTGMTAFSVYTLVTRGWGAWFEFYSPFSMSVLAVPFGFLCLFVAVKGRNPLRPADDARD